MLKPLKEDARGVAQVVIIAIAVVVIAAIAFIGWRATRKDTNRSSSNNAAQQEAENACNKENQDKNLCKFIAGWKELKQYRVEIENTGAGQTTKAIFESDDNKAHIVSEGEGSTVYEIVTVDNTTYTKGADGTWWKKTITKPEDNPAVDYKRSFDEPDEQAPNKPKYEAQGKEACGNHQCFKYKVVDPAQPEDSEYLWFDDDDFLARRIRVEGKDGSISEQKFEYDNVRIADPKPVKDLGPNQYIVPGQNEPVTIPSM